MVSARFASPCVYVQTRFSGVAGVLSTTLVLEHLLYGSVSPDALKSPSPEASMCLKPLAWQPSKTTQGEFK